MEWLKKIAAWLTRPDINVVRILVASASIMIFLILLVNMRTYIWAVRQQEIRMAEREREVRGETGRTSNVKTTSFTFSVNESRKMDKMVIVDVTLRNPNDQPVYFTLAQLRLKDETFMLCDPVLDPRLLEKEKKAVLKDGFLLAGEDVRGVRMFSCSNPGAKKFSLSYGDISGSKVYAADVVPAEMKIAPALTVNESKKVGGIVMIDVTVLNPGEQTKSFSPDQFRLKDERSMMCEAAFDPHLLEKEKKSVLKYGNLLPGEEVRGVIMFACSDPAVKKFALAYGDPQASDSIVTDIVSTEFM